MNEIDLAYIAGIIDGEGSIGINKIKNYNGTNTTYYRLLVQVCMVEGCIPQWLCDAFGAVSFLKVILPYLKIKKEQAEIAIEFQSQRMKSGGIEGKRGQKFKTESEQSIEEAQYTLMRNLKAQEGTYA
jgi:hypothetical protein